MEDISSGSSEELGIARTCLTLPQWVRGHFVRQKVCGCRDIPRTIAEESSAVRSAFPQDVAEVHLGTRGRDRAARSADTLALMDLDAAANRLVREHSGGRIRPLEIALGPSPTSPC